MTFLKNISLIIVKLFRMILSILIIKELFALIAKELLVIYLMNIEKSNRFNFYS